jgi:hypothetical protein
VHIDYLCTSNHLTLHYSQVCLHITHTPDDPSRETDCYEYDGIVYSVSPFKYIKFQLYGERMGLIEIITISNVVALGERRFLSSGQRLVALKKCKSVEARCH